MRLKSVGLVVVSVLVFRCGPAAAGEEPSPSAPPPLATQCLALVRDGYFNIEYANTDALANCIASRWQTPARAEGDALLRGIPNEWLRMVVALRASNLLLEGTDLDGRSFAWPHVKDLVGSDPEAETLIRKGKALLVPKDGGVVALPRSWASHRRRRG